MQAMVFLLPLFSLMKTRGIQFLRFVVVTLFVLTGVVSVAQTFTDVASEMNVSAIPNSLQYGSGMSFYDFNQDGWDDLSFTMVGDSCIFYINQGGTFQQTKSFVYGPGESKHLVWVDYDNDGDLDIAFTTFEGKYKLYQNDGNFNFTDVSVQAGLLQGNERYYGISFADYDRDGDLDFYVACYEQIGTEIDFSRLNHLYRNNGDGTFTNVTLEAGVGDGIRLSFKGVWFDYDMDGWPDLFVINDRVYKNSLYRNNGDGTFTDVSEEAGIQLGGQDPMTATVGDFDNDGDMDIYMTNTSSPFKRGQLLVNNGDGTFSQMAEEYGVDVFGWTWGAVWIDFDNDTDQDLYVANGHPNLGNFDIQNFFLENHGGLFFTDITDSVMLGGDVYRSYSNARGDIDNDGFYDMAVLNRAPHDVNLWHNSGNDNNFIKITLTGTASNIMAIGSWIRVFIDGQQYTQYTMCGENYISQNSQHHIFGLGQATIVDSVEVEYVLGHKDMYYNLDINTHYYFTEGETYHAEISPAGDVIICEGDSTVLDAGEHQTYLWNNGHTERYLTASNSGSFWVEVQNEFGVTSTSDTVVVTVAAEPFVQEIVSHPLCFADTNGTIQLINQTGPQAAEVNWSNGLTGATINNLAGGTYLYTFVDTNGCTSTGNVMLAEPFALSVQSFVSPEFAGDDGSIFLIINGGTPPYTVYLEGVEVSTNIQALSAGIYQLLVVDAHECTYTEQIEVSSLVSARQTYATEFVVFPNPVQSDQFVNVQVPSDLMNVTFTVYDARGAVVWGKESSHLARGMHRIELPVLSVGTYYLSLYSNSGLLTANFVVVDNK